MRIATPKFLAILLPSAIGALLLVPGSAAAQEPLSPAQTPSSSAAQTAVPGAPATNDAPTPNPATNLATGNSGPSRPPEAAPDVNEIMRRAVDNDIVDWQAAKNYTFLERTQEDKLDGSGKVESSKTETREILILYGEPFDRLIAKDGQPLSPKDQKKQDDEFDKETRKRENESPAERQKRLEKYEKDRQESREFVREVLDAYNFKLAGEETLAGHRTWVIDGEPRPGFKPKRKEANLLPKIKPRLWIDQQDYSWVKIHCELLDTISWGLVVARLHKGTQFEMQQTRVNNELWLPQRIDVKLDARVALLMGVNENVHITYTNYRKFRTETKITAGDAPPDGRSETPAGSAEH